MVTAALSDALSSPARVIRQLQAKHASTSAVTFPSVVKKHFKELFSNANAQKIPPLDVSHPPESYSAGSLVKFRAMVQDTSASPEIYLSHTGYGLDIIPASSTDTNGDAFAMHDLGRALDEGSAIRTDNLSERGVVWAVSVPGESEWVSEWLDGSMYPTSSVPPSTSTYQSHKFPLPRTPHVGANIKTYDSADLKPSHVHEFVGILTFEPRLDEATHEEAEELIPSIHVLFHTPSPSTLVKSTYPLPPARGQTRLEVKEDIVRWLAKEALGGDTLAAEYVLLAFLGRVQSRSPPLFPPSLLLSRFPSGLVSDNPLLYRALEQLFPIVAYLPLSLAFLNEHPFAPSSSLAHETEDLRSGALQLPPSSAVLVTEHGIGEGKLGDLGVRNISTLQAVMASQNIAYAFPFSTFEFPTDLSFVILSEGSKSPFFHTDLNLPLRPSARPDSADASETEISLPSPEQLHEWRLWLSGAKSQAASRTSVSVSESVAEYIQAEFVRERKEAVEGEKKMTSDDLALRMSLAKSMALLRHENGVTREVWDIVRHMEHERKQRLR